MLSRWFISFNILNQSDSTFQITPGNVIMEREEDDFIYPEQFLKLQAGIQETIRKNTAYSEALVIINNFKELKMPPQKEMVQIEPTVEEA